MTVDDFAEIFGRAPSTIREWFRKGLVPDAYTLPSGAHRAPPGAVEGTRRALKEAARQNARTVPRGEDADLSACRTML